VVVCVVLSSLVLYYFIVYRPAKVAIKGRKESLRKIPLHINSIKRRKNSQSGIKAELSRSIGYWNKISTLCWHALQYISVKVSPFVRLKNRRIKKRLMRMKWCTMNMPLTFQGTVVDGDSVDFNILGGVIENDSEIDRDGSKQLKGVVDEMKYYSLSSVPPEILNMIDCSSSKKQLFMSLSTPKTKPKRVSIISKDVISIPNPLPNFDPNPKSHPNPTHTPDVLSKIELIIKKPKHDTKRQRAWMSQFISDPHKALSFLATKVDFSLHSAYFNNEKIPSRSPNSKIEELIQRLSSEYIPYPISDHTSNPSLHPGSGINLVTLPSLSEALDSTWDIFYPDGIKMVDKEREEAKELLYKWARSTSNPKPYIETNIKGKSAEQLYVEYIQSEIDNESAAQINDGKIPFQMPKARSPSHKFKQLSRKPSINNLEDDPNDSPDDNLVTNGSTNDDTNITLNFDLFKIWFIKVLIVIIHGNESGRLLDYVLNNVPLAQIRMSLNAPSVKLSSRPFLPPVHDEETEGAKR
jgi:hypothetical protein